MTSQVEPVIGHTEVLSGEDSPVVARAAAALRSGKLVGIPTDTVYGLAVAIDAPRAIERLYAVKGRSRDKPIPILLSSPEHIGKVSSCQTDHAWALARRFWPGALTLIVPARMDLHPLLTGIDVEHGRTVAVRVPDHQLARAIIAAAGGALAVTSANRSGEPPATSAETLLELDSVAPDIVIDGGRAALGLPSTIVAATGTEPVIVRVGAISAGAIGAVFRESGLAS